MARSINSFLSLLDESYKPVDTDVTMQIGPSGERRKHIRLREDVTFRTRMEAIVSVASADGAQDSVPVLTPLEEMLRLKVDPNVTKVTRILSVPACDGADLYNILETIERDIRAYLTSNAKYINKIAARTFIVKQGWTTSLEIKSFTHSINNEQVLGDQARHARDDWQPPENPMYLPEARAYTRNLALKWIAWKLASKPI